MFEIKNLLDLPSGPWIIGHRGACGESPENTIESFQLAIVQGVCMIEMDLQLTADGHIVVVHDQNLERVAGTKIEVETSTLATLKNYNVAFNFRAHGVPALIPTLLEVLDAIPPSMPLNLELKCFKANPSKYIRTLEAIIAERDKLLISSFNWDLLRECRRQVPNLLIAPLADETLEGLLGVAEELLAVSVHCNFEIIDNTFVKAANANGRPVLVYTVNDASTAKQLFDKGVSGIFTNLPAQLFRELRM